MNLIIDLDRLHLTTTMPVSRDEAKTQLRITYTEDDTEIDSMISRAVKEIENYCNISIVYQRITMIADLKQEWKLPYGPVIGLESVETKSAPQGSGIGIFSTASANWQIDADNFDPGKYCYRWRLVYTAGMSAVPDDLKQAILLQMVHLFEHRGDEQQQGLSMQAKEMVDPYKVLLWL